jgi:hypothetical protein
MRKPEGAVSGQGNTASERDSPTSSTACLPSATAGSAPTCTDTPVRWRANHSISVAGRVGSPWWRKMRRRLHSGSAPLPASLSRRVIFRLGLEAIESSRRASAISSGSRSTSKQVRNLQAVPSTGLLARVRPAGSLWRVRRARRFGANSTIVAAGSGRR